MKLSIVIPAYNIESYIDDCLGSIFCQNVSEDLLEVIVINDGSTDGTPRAIEEYAKEHRNLVYISQENQGLSGARNSGLRRATGDLVWFVDGDDRVTENSIQTILSYFEKYPNADLLTFDRIHYNLSDGTKRYCKSWGDKRIGWNLKEKNDIYEKPLNGETACGRLVSGVVWFHVIKRTFLLEHDLFFAYGLPNEDTEFQMRLFFFVKESRFIPFAHYEYLAMRPGSLTGPSGRSMKWVRGSVKTWHLWKEFGERCAETSSQKNYVNRFISSKLGSDISIILSQDNKELKDFYIQNKREWRKMLSSTFWKSFELPRFPVLRFIRYLVALSCPKCMKYTSLSAWRKMLKE